MPASHLLIPMVDHITCPVDGLSVLPSSKDVCALVQLPLLLLFFFFLKTFTLYKN